jgi:hypothetical protein
MSLSHQNSVFDFFMSSSGTCASPPVSFNNYCVKQHWGLRTTYNITSVGDCNDTAAASCILNGALVLLLKHKINIKQKQI